MSGARLYRVSALVVRQRGLGEADRIVVLLTPERGKISAVAKGARRARSKLASGTQLFCHARMQLAAGRSLEVVTQAQAIHMFYHLREDLARFTHACYASELVDALTEERHPDSAVFQLLLDTLRGLDSGGDPVTLARALELNLLTHLGFGPELHTCVCCGLEIEGGETGFSVPQGGAVCGRCLRARAGAPLTPEALRAMWELLALPAAELARRRLKASVQQELERLLRAYVDYQLERPLRSAAFLRR